MALPHFFIEQALDHTAGDEISLRPSTQLMAHLHALRLKAGQSIVLVDRPGHGWKMTLAAPVLKKAGVLAGTLVEELSSAQKTSVTLVQGISASMRMDQTIRQVTELGIARIIPLEAQRCTVRLRGADAHAKTQRWQRIAQEAAQQSCQLWCPDIDPVVGLEDALRMLEGYDLLLLFWEEAQSGSVADALGGLLLQQAETPVKIALFVGPEGGFSLEEAQTLKAQGARVVSLGATILRTETAAVVASALTLYELGALGGS